MIKNLALLLLVHLVILSNLTFTAWPEMLSYPYLLMHGFDYSSAVIPYPIGLLAPLGLIYKIFGFQPIVLKIFTWTSLLITDAVVFLLLKKLAHHGPVVIFLLIYILLSSVLDGNMMWFDNATVLPLALAFYFSLGWIKNFSNKYLFLLGLSLAWAAVIKQIALLFLIGFVLFYFLKRGKLTGLIYLLAGSLVIFAPFLTYLITTSTALDFWLWAIYYPSLYWSKVPGYVRLSLTRSELLVLALLMAPLMAAFFTKRGIWRGQILLTVTFLISAVVAIYPRFSYFHLQPALLFLILLYFQLATKRKISTLLTLGVALVVFGLLMPRTVGSSTRFYSPQDPLLEKIIQEVENGQKVMLLGLNSSYYVLADRLPPKPWVDNFSWYLEIPGVQQRVIEGLERDHVRVIFRKVPQKGAWYELNVYQPSQLIKFIKSKFSLKETIDDIEIWRKN